MAITYNGTPVTSVLMDGVTYTTIADENGYLYYACNPVCYYSGGNDICYRFVGFDYDGNNTGGNDYARAIFEICGCANTDGYLCWVGGKRSCSNVQYSTTLGYQLGCTILEAVGCGQCGINYTFRVNLDAQPVTVSIYEAGEWPQYCSLLEACEACTKICAGTVWTHKGVNCRLYSDWVVIDRCDYLGLTNQSTIAICTPTILPHCASVSAFLKSETGYTEIKCSYEINPIGCRNRGITCSIQIC